MLIAAHRAQCASWSNRSAPFMTPESAVAFQPGRRFDEDLLRAAAVRFGIPDHGGARQPDFFSPMARPATYWAAGARPRAGGARSLPLLHPQSVRHGGLMRKRCIRYFVTHETLGKRLQPAALGNCSRMQPSKSARSATTRWPRWTPLASPERSRALGTLARRPLETCRAGTYDDFDPLIRSWRLTQDERSSGGAWSGTLTYSSSGRGSRIRLRWPFADLCYTKAWNRGSRSLDRWRHARFGRSVRAADRVAERYPSLLSRPDARVGDPRDGRTARSYCKLHRRGCADRPAIGLTRASHGPPTNVLATRFSLL